MARKIIEDGRPRVHLSDLPAEDLPVCKQLLDERVIITRRGLYLHFHFELFLEYVGALWMISECTDEATASDRIGVLQRACRNSLVNMPGIVENLVLSWQADANLVTMALKLLAGSEDRWKAIACSILRKLEVSSADHTEIIAILAEDRNYVIRQFLAQGVDGHLRKVGRSVLSTLTGSASWEARETAATIIGGVEESLDGDMSTRLVELAGDFHWRVRRAAGYALMQRKKCDASVRALIDKSATNLDSLSWRQKYALCIALLKTDLSPKSSEALAIFSMAKDDNHQVRWSVANYAPRYLGGDRIALLAQLARDPDAWVRCRAASSLVQMLETELGSHAEGLLIQLSSDESEAVRLRLARELAAVKKGEWHLPLLREYLRDTADIAFAASYTLDTFALSMDGEDLAGSNGLEDTVRILRERIARQDLNPVTAKFSPIQEYISRRTEFRPQNDSYMRVIDTMCSLIESATLGISEQGHSVDSLYEVLLHDYDETVRWALVLFLADYSTGKLNPQHRLRLFERMAVDQHWWIRREVAIALGRTRNLVENRLVQRLLLQMLTSEQRSDHPCADEVVHYIRLSLSVGESASTT